MTRPLIIWGGRVIAALFPVLALSAQPFNFYGIWRIDTLVGFSEISISQEKLEKFLGERVVISKSHLMVGNDNCKIRHLRESTLDTTQLLLEGYKADPKNAGVSLRTRILKIEPCGDVFQVGNDIVISKGGAFFRANRAK